MTDIAPVLTLRIGTDHYLRGMSADEFTQRFEALQAAKPGQYKQWFKVEKAYGGCIVERIRPEPGTDGDKYGVKSLEVNQERFVSGGSPQAVSKYLYNMRKRWAELRLRKFQAVECDGGVIVRRLR